LPADAARADGKPAFSPDGRRLYFEGVREGEPQCWSLDLSEGTLLRVTTEGKPSRTPAPIAEHLIVVEREVDGRAQLVIVDCQSMRERELTGEPCELERREPAAVAAGGKVRLAWREAPEPGGRDEIVVARVKGIFLDDNDDAEAPRAMRA
jgi:hypothetical protein